MQTNCRKNRKVIGQTDKYIYQEAAAASIVHYCSFNNDMQQAGLLQLDALCKHQNLPLLRSTSKCSITVNMVSMIHNCL